MRKLMMILFTVAIASVSTKAQEAKQPPPKKTPEERADAITQRMTKSLALTADQQTKIKALVLKREKEADELRGKAKDTNQKLQAEMDADLKTILNPEQYEKFKKHQEEMKKKREENKAAHRKAVSGEEPPPPPPGENPPPPAPEK